MDAGQFPHSHKRISAAPPPTLSLYNCDNCNAYVCSFQVLHTTSPPLPYLRRGGARCLSLSLLPSLLPDNVDGHFFTFYLLTQTSFSSSSGVLTVLNDIQTYFFFNFPPISCQTVLFLLLLCAFFNNVSILARIWILLFVLRGYIDKVVQIRI